MTVAFASTTEMVMLADTLLPSLDVAVMVAVPMATPLTMPSLSTVATAVLLLVQVRLLSVALAGATVAVSCSWRPSATLEDVADRVTPVTATCAALTVRVMLPETLLPPLALAVMVTVPAATAVTRPSLLTVATAALLLVQLRLLSVASVGATVAVSCSCCPTSRVLVPALTLTAVTGTMVSSV